MDEVDWATELRNTKMSYEGEEVSVAGMLTAWQVRPGLPPVGISGSIDALELAEGYVKDCLLDPTRSLQPEDEMPQTFGAGKTWVKEADWHDLARLCFERNILGLISDDEVFQVRRNRNAHCPRALRRGEGQAR
eukprot:10696501-Heterocapsa_arctica.AAC.1